jgi:hypothetical protein
MVDILVYIPADQEDHVRATKLNPISGLTDGYWTLSGCPRFTKPGDRIWFTIYGEIIASARIIRLDDYYDDRDGGPAVSFDIPTVQGHSFDPPRELPLGFRGFRYVRRESKHTSIRHTKALEVVGAEEAERIYPRNW